MTLTQYMCVAPFRYIVACGQMMRGRLSCKILIVNGEIVQNNSDKMSYFFKDSIYYRISYFYYLKLDVFSDRYRKMLIAVAAG